MDTLFHVIVPSVLGLVAGLLGAYLKSYGSEKGKNLATKEDIEEITRKVEGVKTQHAAQLESTKKDHAREIEELRSELSHRSHISRMQFEKEFRIYEEVWAKLVDLRSATLRLRPMIDSIDPNESEEDRRLRRLQTWGQAYDDYTRVVEVNRPFFSDEVYRHLDTLGQYAYGEGVDYQILDSKSMRQEYWKEARKNQKQIIEHIDVICEAIRKRIEGLQVES
jgi:hypothetical protein